MPAHLTGTKCNWILEFKVVRVRMIVVFIIMYNESSNITVSTNVVRVSLSAVGE
jgi:hypothetical protein